MHHAHTQPSLTLSLTACELSRVACLPSKYEGCRWKYNDLPKALIELAKTENAENEGTEGKTFWDLLQNDWQTICHFSRLQSVADTFDENSGGWLSLIDSEEVKDLVVSIKRFLLSDLTDSSEVLTLKEVRLARKVLATLDALKKSKEQTEADEKFDLEAYQQKVSELPTDCENFWNFYLTSYDEYSPAEGGCYYYHRKALACYPLSKFDSLEQAKAFARDTFGVTFEGDTTETSGGYSRKVRGFTSASPEADCEVYAQRFPFQEVTTRTPRYE